jgi:hypothetical protein
VNIDGRLSKEITVTSGVPQGSHIGPLLFLMFINDLTDVFKNSQFLLYADDLKLFKIVNTVEDARALQADLYELVVWCASNLMELNVKKCETITFSRKPADRQISTAYVIGQDTLERIDVVRDLGVLMDTKLSFKQHIDHVISKAKLILGFIKRQTREYRCPFVSKSLYCALARSILEYGCTVWFPYTMTDSRRIESVQKQFLLFALRRLPWSDPFILPHYEDRLRLLNMETLEKRRKLFSCLLIFDILRDRILAPELKSMVSVRQYCRATRWATNSDVPVRLVVPITGTVYEANDPLIRGCRLFNSIANCYDSKCSRETFKARIRARI